MFRLLLRPSSAPLAILLCTLLAHGCAQGSSRDGDGDGGRSDSGSSDGGADAGPSDGGGGGGDGGGSECREDGLPDSCPDAMDLGALEPGGMPIMQEGTLPTAAARDWFQVAFPPGYADGGMGGDGNPTIEVLPEDAGLLIELRQSCAAAMPCSGEGPAQASDLTSWSFADDLTRDGGVAYTTREQDWPSSVNVKVYREEGAGNDCATYTLRISR